jgi:hypothetical protein
MNIMIDYDRTYTADVDMWRKIIPIFLENHKVYLVTSRDMDTPIELTQDFINWNIPIIYCQYMAKRDVCAKQGIYIDIWIDDDPHYIDTGFVTEDFPLQLIKNMEKDFR